MPFKYPKYKEFTISDHADFKYSIVENVCFLFYGRPIHKIDNHFCISKYYREINNNYLNFYDWMEKELPLLKDPIKSSYDLIQMKIFYREYVKHQKRK